MSIESRIDIVVKNLNQLNKLAANLQNINKTNTQLVKGLGRVEARLAKLNKTDLSKAERSLNNMRQNVDKLDKATGTSGVARTFQNIGTTVKAAAESFSRGFSRTALTSAVLGIGKIGLAGGALKSVLAGVSGQWTLIAAAMMGFGPQIVSSILGISQGLIKVTGGLKNLGKSATETLIGITGGVKNLKLDINETTKSFQNMLVGASLSELNMHVGSARKEMESFWHMTRGAEEAAKKLALAMAAQKKEQAALNKLLLQAQGKSTASAADRAAHKTSAKYRQRQLDMGWNLGSYTDQEGQQQYMWRKASLDIAKQDVQLAEERLKTVLEEEKSAARAKKFREMTQKQARKDKQANIDSRFRENLMLGVGFPMLFGGGVGSIAGGASGAMLQRKMGTQGGFGAQILLSALGQQFDALISSMVASTQKLGNALGQYTQDTGQLVESLGLAGTAEGQRIKIIEELEGKQAAFNAALRQLTNAVGAKGAADLKEFGDNWRVVSSEFKIFFTQVQAGIANLINAADRFFGVSEGAKETRLDRFIATTDDSEIKKLREQRAGLDATKVKGGELLGEFMTGTDTTKAAQLDARIEALAKEKLARQDAQVAIDNALMGEQKLLAEKKEQFEIDKRITELKKGGMNEALASEIAKLEQVHNQGTRNLEQEKKALQEKIRNSGWTDELGTQLKEINKALEERVKLLGMSTEELKKYIAAQKDSNEETDKNKVTWEDIKEKLATGLQSAIEGLIDGTKTLGESLAGIAKSIGSMFLQAGIRSAFGLAEGGYATGGIKAFSSGGLVTRPTIGLVGEAGEDEYIIPSSKMQGAMERYSAGARGQGVIPGGGTVASGSGVSSTPTVVNYTGPVLSFDSEAYVPKSAIPEIINSAARRGAQEGQSKVFSQLKNSRSQRSRVGL